MSSPTPATGSARSSRSAETGADPASLLERDGELAQLGALVAEIGAGQSVVIEGPAGIGKTALLVALETYAERAGITVLRATGGELERDLGWKVVRELFDPLVAHADESARERLYAGAAKLAEPVLGHAAPQPDASGADRIAAALHGLYWLTANAGGRGPLLIAVDDAHWADTASLRWLAHLAARVEGLPIVLAMTVRPGEPTSPDDPLRAALLSGIADRSLRLRPRPLAQGAAVALVRRALSADADERFCTACHAAAGGNPFLLTELVHALADDGVPPTREHAARIKEIRSDAISHGVLLRLARMPREAVELASAVAVLGHGARVHQAAELAGVDPDIAVRAAATLAAADILRDEVPLDFVHPVVRSVVYAQLPAVQRAHWHERAARLLDSQAAPRGDVARHLLFIEPRNEPWVAATLVEAAEDASRDGALDTAGAYLRRALEEPPDRASRPHVLRLLGRAETATSGPAGYATLREAFDATDDAHERAAIAIELGGAVRMTGAFSAAVEPLERALAALEPGSSIAREATGELIGVAMLDLATLPVAASRLAPFLAAPGQASDAAVRAAAALAITGSGTRPAVETAALGRGVLEADGARQNPSAVVAAASVLAASDELAEATAAWDDFIADARSRGSALAYAFACFHRADVNYRLGSVPAAEADGRSAAEIFREWSIPLATPLVDALLERDVSAAEEALGSARLPADLPETWAATWSLFGRGKVKLARALYREAADDLLECGRRLDAWGCVNPALSAWRSSAALALAGCDDTSGALKLVHEEIAAARSFGAGRALGIALRAGGQVESGERGEALLREAIEVLSPSEARLEHARALCDLGASLRRAGQRREAREPLREALDAASTCGATLLAQQARAELAATGAKPRRDALRGREALTASELRVVEMAARAMPNRDIAQALFVTQRTVETHLTHAYSKLGIGSRRELRDALDQRDSSLGR